MTSWWSVHCMLHLVIKCVEGCHILEVCVDSILSHRSCKRMLYQGI